MRTIRCEPSPVSFFNKHKGCSQLSGYGVCLNFCSLPCSQEDFLISTTIFKQLPVVHRWFVISPGSQEVCGKINFPNVYANTMFARVYATLYRIFIIIIATSHCYHIASWNTSVVNFPAKAAAVPLSVAKTMNDFQCSNTQKCLYFAFSFSAFHAEGKTADFTWLIYSFSFFFIFLKKIHTYRRFLKNRWL